MVKTVFSKIILIITDGLTKELCVAAHLVTRDLIRLGRKSGWLFMALYCKQAMSNIRVAYGGIQTPHQLSSPQVSLNKSGFPRIIPKTPP